MVSSILRPHGRETQFSDCDPSFLVGFRKRMKLSAYIHHDIGSHSLLLENHAELASSMELSLGCANPFDVNSSCCNCDEQVSSRSGPEMSCQSNGYDSNIYQSSDAVGLPDHDTNYLVYTTPTSVTGWMYVNQDGQMCGPYIKEQLYEGLSTGFLPEELVVYPILNGTLINPVPLNYFKQFPDHVDTGFAYLAAAALSGVRQNVSCSTSFREQSSEDSCWFFEDDKGKKQGPHSLIQLHKWSQLGYFHDSTVIFHVLDKVKPLTLQSLLSTWGTAGSRTIFSSVAKDPDTGSLSDFVAGISEDVGKELHVGIMKAARRVFMDEIVSDIIIDYVSAKKTDKHSKCEPGNRIGQACPSNVEMFEATPGREDTFFPGGDAEVPDIVFHRCCTTDIMPNSPAPAKSVGSFENFYDIYLIVCRMIFNSCMQVMWNGVLYDIIAECMPSWRKRKRWSRPSKPGMSLKYPKRIENLLTEQENAACEIEYPPGFEPVTIPLDASPPLPTHLLKPENLAEQSPPITHNINVDIADIMERVINDLHFSTKMPLAEYFEGLLVEEVGKVADSVNASQLNEDAADASANRGNASGYNKTSSDDCSAPSSSGVHDFVPSEKSERQCVVHDYVLSGAVSLSIACQKMPVHLKNLSSDWSVNELQPCECKDIVRGCVPPLLSRNMHLRSDDCIPKITVYTTLAMCHKKIHDDALRELKLLLVDDALKGLLMTWYTLKMRNKSHFSEAAGGKNVETVDSSVPHIKYEVSKYTYYRKKKSFGRKTGSLCSVTTEDVGLDRQLVEKSRKPEMSGAPESSTIDYSIGNSKNVAQGNCNSEIAINADMFGDCSSASDTSSQGVSNLAKDNKAKGNKPSRNKQKTSLYSVNSNNENPTSCKSMISKMVEVEPRDCSKNMKISKVEILKRKRLADDISPSRSRKVRRVGNDKQSVCKLSVGRNIKTSKTKTRNPCPESDGCARSSINGWEWHKWSMNASPAERSRIRGAHDAYAQYVTADSNSSHLSHNKVLSARTNRVKLRNLIAAAEGADILKATQLKARKKRLRFQRSKIHDWGLIALEPIEAEDFVIEYVGELIRPRISDLRERQYEKMGIGSSYLFRLDDGYVVDATKRGGIARFINHSCEVKGSQSCYVRSSTGITLRRKNDVNLEMLFGSLTAIQKSLVLRVRKRFSYTRSVKLPLEKKLRTITSFHWKKKKFLATVDQKDVVAH